MHHFFEKMVEDWKTNVFHIDRLISLPFCLGSSWFVVLLFCCMLQGHDSLLFFSGGWGVDSPWCSSWG